MQIQEQADLKGKSATDAQSHARKLVRRLMAERNLRTEEMARLVGLEAHTMRRLLKGIRNVTLDEMILIASIGGFSLDEHFLNRPASPVASQPAAVENNLSRVFAAIADLLAPNGNTAPASSPPSETLFTSRTEAHPKVRSAPEEGGKRRRGRPRKYPLEPSGGQGPQS